MRTALRSRAALTVACAGAILAVAASPAWAIRYASATSTTTTGDCDAAAPCTLKAAIEGGTTKPADGEEIVVEPGGYSVTSTITTGAANLDVHGVDGQPMPQITGTGTGELLSTGPGTQALHLTDLDLENMGEINDQDAFIDRVILRGNAGGNLLCQCYSDLPGTATIRNSLVVVTGGAGGLGVSSNGGSANIALRNDTVVSTAAGSPAVALDQLATGSGVLTLTATNTIAVNLANPTAIAVVAEQPGAGPSTTITFDHSAVGSSAALGGATVSTTSTPAAGPPVFVDAAGGNYREAAGSPTVDTGFDTSLDGPLDLDGDVRQAGAHTDIGAYEFGSAPPPPASPVTPAPTPIVTPPPPPSPPAPPKPKLALSSKTATVSRSTGTATLGVTCATTKGLGCIVAGSLTGRLPHHKTSSRVGTVTGLVTAGRPGRLRLALTKTARAALLGLTGHDPHLTATAKLTVGAGAAPRASQSFTVKLALAAAPKHWAKRHQA